jgi:hypothetical protein
MSFQKSLTRSQAPKKPYHGFAHRAVPSNRMGRGRWCPSRITGDRQGVGAKSDRNGVAVHDLRTHPRKGSIPSSAFPWCPSSLSFRSIRMRGRRGVSSMRRCTWIWKVRPGSHARMGAPVLRARTTLQVLSLIHELSVDGAQTSLRDVYYRDPMLFESQRNSDEVISTFQPMVLRPVSVNSLLCRPSI